MSRLGLYSALLAALVVGVLLTAGATAAPPTPPTIGCVQRTRAKQTSASFTFSDDETCALPVPTRQRHVLGLWQPR